MMTTTTTSPSSAYRAIVPAFLACLIGLAGPRMMARAATHRAADIKPCQLLTPAVAKTILGSTPRPGVSSPIPRQDGSEYTACVYLRTGHGSFAQLQFGIYQHNPSSHLAWNADSAWTDLKAGFKAAGYATQSVSGLGNGAVWIPMLSEAAVLKKPTAIVVLLYTVSGKQTPLATMRSAMKAVLKNFH